MANPNRKKRFVVRVKRPGEMFSEWSEYDSLDAALAAALNANRLGLIAAVWDKSKKTYVYQN